MVHGLSLVAALTVAASAACAIVAAYRGNQRGVFLFKPLTTTLVIASALWVFAPSDAQYQDWILLGLLFSLAGDVFLMLGERRFLLGLASFLVAHLVYARAFTLGVGLDA